MSIAYDRIYFFGDSITLGCNDSLDLGWPGRVCRGMTKDGRGVAVYNLGINGDTSGDIDARWYTEMMARNRGSAGLLVFAFGFNDAAHKNSDRAQVELELSVNTARKIMSLAQGISKVMWIGPTPLDETVNPLDAPDGRWLMYNEEIEKYDSAYAYLANQMKIDYLSLYQEYRDSPRYQAALVAGDKVHPADDGYAMIAESVTNWGAWRKLFRTSLA
jgi:acyl-CoA thioesterase-1